ncbi:hypothetical protein ABT346_20780 [Micromonospora peucetia]|uniref:hypothetical protein n=1 Tax=Micromonospora peucetia TaxID=47871 RepID=UPI00331A15C5
MTQPNDPTEALPTHRLPAGGAPTMPPASADATVHLTAGAETARLACGDATVYLAANEPTAPLASADATVYLAANESTASLASGDATVYLAANEPTAPLASADATVYLAAGDRTVRLAVGDPTVHLTAGEPTAHLVGGGSTMPRHAPDGQTDAGRTAYPASGEQTIPVAAVDTGRTAGLGRTPDTWRTVGTGHTLGAGRTTGAGMGSPFVGPVGGEVRFGPGVPTTPPPAPVWPAPPTRRRSAWRTVTSVLSTLLTVALLAAVGLYLWQRISPLEVTGVTVTAPRPAGERCDVTVDVVATVSTNGRAGQIRYQWLRSGSAPGSLLTERVGRGQRTVELTLRWSFSGVGSTTETATVNITSPSPVQAQTPVSYDCRRR